MSVRITKVETVAVRTTMREPLVWPGGTRHSASGVVIQIHTDEGLVGVGEAPGPTLPTIQTIVDAELGQFLIDQDLKSSGSCTGWKSSRATGAGWARMRSPVSRWPCST